MFCPKCGNQISENDRYCYRCGYVINGNKQQDEEPDYGYDTVYRDNRRHSNDKRKHDDYDRPSVGLNIIAFLFPFIGIIMYFCMKRDTRRRADSILVSAVISFAICVMMLMFTVFIGVLNYTEDTNGTGSNTYTVEPSYGDGLEEWLEEHPVNVDSPEFRASCNTYSYEELLRHSDDYVGEHIKVKVTAENKLGYESNAWSCADMTGENRYVIEYELSDRLLADDVVTIYGIFYGTVETQTVLGVTNDAPYIEAVGVSFD